MVKSRKEKRSESKALSISHPNSRKALRLAKQAVREKARLKSKMAHAIKRNLFGEKLMWFQQHLLPDVLVYTPEQLSELILKYINRNDEELEQIKLKHSIGQRKNRQHASREDVIRITKERELEEFNGAGLEMVDILRPKTLEAFRSWDGNFGRLGLMKIARFSRSFLEKYKPLPVSKDLLDRQERIRTESLSENCLPNENEEEMSTDDDGDDEAGANQEEAANEN